MTILTIEALCNEAALFSAAESRHPEPLLYGVTDGKAIGTYLGCISKISMIFLRVIQPVVSIFQVYWLMLR